MNKWIIKMLLYLLENLIMHRFKLFLLPQAQYGGRWGVQALQSTYFLMLQLAALSHKQVGELGCLVQ